MKKSNGVIFFAILVVVAFWGLVFMLGSDGNPKIQNDSTQTGNLISSSTNTNTETTTEITTEESTIVPETTTEESTTEEETTTKKTETTTKKTETTTKKVTTTKKETTTKKVTTTVDPDSQVIVYVTKSGEKYHHENPCGNGTYYESTLAKAKARGLTPCEKCVLH